MTGKVIQMFPDQAAPEAMSLEDVVSVELDPTPPAPQPTFLDWVYNEVPDFQTFVAGLCDVAEHGGPDAFWPEVERLREQINGWAPPSGSA